MAWSLACLLPAEWCGHSVYGEETDIRFFCCARLSAQVPDVDASASVPDVSASIPEASVSMPAVSGDVEGAIPSVDVGLSAPSVDLPGRFDGMDLRRWCCTFSGKLFFLVGGVACCVCRYLALYQLLHEVVRGVFVVVDVVRGFASPNTPIIISFFSRRLSLSSPTATHDRLPRLALRVSVTLVYSRCGGWPQGAGRARSEWRIS